MFKKAIVVMLPTNKSKIFLHAGGDLCINTVGDRTKAEFTSPQHLYILSDDKIEEGNWFYHPLGEILQCTKREGNFIWYEKLTVPGVSKIGQPFSIHINLHPKKIIATTDSSLKLKEHCTCSESEAIYCGYPKIEGLCQQLLPQLSQSFIEKYVEEYNNGNCIEEILVEYEEC